MISLSLFHSDLCQERLGLWPSPWSPDMIWEEGTLCVPSAVEEDALRETSLVHFFFFFLLLDFFEGTEEGEEEEESLTNTTLWEGSLTEDSNPEECLPSTAKMCSLSSDRLS